MCQITGIEFASIHKYINKTTCITIHACVFNQFSWALTLLIGMWPVLVGCSWNDHRRKCINIVLTLIVIHETNSETLYIDLKLNVRKNKAEKPGLQSTRYQGMRSECICCNVYSIVPSYLRTVLFTGLTKYFNTVKNTHMACPKGKEGFYLWCILAFHLFYTIFFVQYH